MGQQQSLRVEYLAVGQPGPYQDSEVRGRLYVGMSSPWVNKGQWLPAQISKDRAKEALMWFVPFSDNYYGPFLSRLDNIEPGIWEFSVVTRYSD